MEFGSGSPGSYDNLVINRKSSNVSSLNNYEETSYNDELVRVESTMDENINFKNSIKSSQTKDPDEISCKSLYEDI